MGKYFPSCGQDWPFESCGTPSSQFETICQESNRLPTLHIRLSPDHPLKFLLVAEALLCAKNFVEDWTKLSEFG